MRGYFLMDNACFVVCVGALYQWDGTQTRGVGKIGGKLELVLSSMGGHVFGMGR